MMAFSDMALYGAVLGLVGMNANARLKDLNVHFLAAPRQTDVVALAEIVKHGAGLVVGRVVCTAESTGLPCFEMSASYSIAPAPRL